MATKKILLLSLLLSMVAVLTTTVGAAPPSSATRLRGIVRDSVTHEPIPFARVFMLGALRGGLTDDNGSFDLTTVRPVEGLEVSAMGYSSKTLKVKNGVTTNLTVDLPPTGVTLSNVTVKPRKEKYSKRNNPAVDFAVRLRNSREMTDPRRNDYYNYDKYERITLGFNQISPNDQKNLFLKRYAFLKDNIDTSEVSGNQILPISVKEKSSRVHYRKNPRSEKEVIEGRRQVGMDEIFNKESMQTFYEDVMREVDIFQNDITILQNRFVSPLSAIAPDFYKFYLTDTVDVGGERCVELSFVPRNSQTFGFTGKLYVPQNDTTMFVKKIVMNVPHAINLNFIEQLYLNQEFQRAPDGSRLKMRDDLVMEMDILPGAQKMYARRNTAYTHHSFDPTDDSDRIFASLGSSIESPDASKVNELFWYKKRLVPISKSERGVDRMMLRLREDKLYYWSEKALKTFVGGYIATGNPSKFDIGPLNTTYSYNSLEGTRLRLGGMTTANLSDRLFGRGYAAYGFRDHKWKYKGEAEWSFIPKKYHSREFPVHSLRLTHLYDVDMIGQHYEFTNMDNMFLSLKRMEDLQITYHRVTSLEYNLELPNNFSLYATVAHERQEATPYIQFVDGIGQSYGHYDQSSLKVQLRYAPGEKFYQTKSYRIPINLDAPVLSLSHTISPGGFLGNRFTINRTEASVQKRFWFSAFGYTDLIVKGGHVWSRVAYPNLIIPNANLSYTIQPESFALLNPMEFLMDSYGMWDFTYWANGAIFNYIPYFRSLKLREVFGFRGFFGHLSDKNNPSLDPSLFRFPEEANRRSLSTGTPYMEASVGVENIFKILRVDYVWRLSYLNQPNISKGGVRIAVHVTF